MLSLALTQPARNCPTSVCYGAEANQILQFQRVHRKTADGDDRPVDGQRGDDGVDARAVRQAGVHHRRRLVDAPAHPGDDPVENRHQVPVVEKTRAGAFEQSLALDINMAIGVDQDVGDARIAEERFDRAESAQFIDDFTDEKLEFLLVQEGFFLAKYIAYHFRQFGAGVLDVHGIEGFQIDFLDQAGMNLVLDGVIEIVFLVIPGLTDFRCRRNERVGAGGADFWLREKKLFNFFSPKRLCPANL